MPELTVTEASAATAIKANIETTDVIDGLILGWTVNSGLVRIFSPH
ncbi:MAG: hypothetical protein OXE81_04045 [Gammaproteobacteria bacterium]|nr:hypothetical protein [Gammaproteobacteria bacterium]